MKSTTSTLLIAIAAAMVIVFACKKNNNGLDTAYEAQNATQQWHSEFIKTASSEETAKADTLLKSLEYNFTYTVRGEKDAELLLIQQKTKGATGTTRFLALRKRNNGFDLDGIYETSNITVIQRFFETKTLKPHESIVVWSLKNTPVKAWVADENSIIRYKKGMGVPKGQDVKEAFRKQQSVASATVRLNNEPLPPSPCTAWYWIWFDPSTGEIISVDYLYTTGDCENDGSGGSANPDNQCNMTEEAAIAYLNSITAEDEDEVTYEEGAEITDGPGVIRAPKNTKWWFLTLDMSAAYKPEYSALFTGVIHKKPGTPWQWWSFAFDKVMQTGGHTPPCTSVEVPATVSTVISADSTIASVALTYAARAKADWVYGSQWKGIKSDTKYKNFPAHL